jgi:hypothetical protein
MATRTLLNAITSAQTGPQTTIEQGELLSSTGKTVFQVTKEGGSAASAVTLEGSLDNKGWVPLATITIPASATATVSDGVFVDLLWLYIRARATAVGAGSAITATIYRAGA